MANHSHTPAWQERLQQAQAVRRQHVQRLMQGPTILRNAVLDTPLVIADSHVGTVGEALKFEDYLAFPATVPEGRPDSMPQIAQVLANKREEIDACVGQMIEATLHTRAGITSTQRYRLYQSLSEFCGCLKLAVQLGADQAGHTLPATIADPARYETALRLESCMPEIERGLRHAKSRMSGVAAARL